MRRLLLLLLFCLSCAATRYTMTQQQNGDIVLHPVAPADLDGDGDSGDSDDFAIFQRERTAPGVATKPAEPPPVDPPPTPVSCTRTVTPADKFQTAVDAARPGDVICFAGGDYKGDSGGWNYAACLAVNVSGEPGKPITLRAAAGEKPIFWGNTFTWAIRVGYCDYRGPQDPSAKGVHDVIVDGLSATQAAWDGFEIANSSNVVIRDCRSYANNFGSTTGYKCGYSFEGSRDFTIERCRSFDNGIGISIGVEQASNPTPQGVAGVVVRDCFIYGNSRSANVGNSSGLELWFCDRAIVEGNIIYDNPDSGINGEGNNQCQIRGNIFLNQWQPGGNNEGGKICVRGGGGNVVAGNIFASNNNCGWDATSGIGDLLLGNTMYGNGSWGILAEGRETVLFNNLIAGNSTRVDNAYPEQDGTGWSLISDWNHYGAGPLKSTSNDTLATLPPHTSVGPVSVSGVSLPRTDPRQIIHPMQAFGTEDIQQARDKIRAAYRPTPSLPGAPVADVQSMCNANVPQVKSALDAAIAAAESSPDHQMKQASYRWGKLKQTLTGYDLTGLPDTGAIGAVK